MKYLAPILIVTLFTGLLLPACQQTPGPITAEQAQAVKDEVRPAVLGLIDALEKRDLKRALDYFSTSPDAAFVLEGKIHSLDEIRKIEKERWSDVAESNFEFEDPKVSVLSTEAIVGSVEGLHSAKDTLGETFGGPIAWTMVWVKENGEWKLLQGHFSEPLVLAIGDW